MKKILTFVLSLMLCLALAGCKNDSPVKSDGPNEPNTPVKTTQDEPDTTIAPNNVTAETLLNNKWNKNDSLDADMNLTMTVVIHDATLSHDIGLLEDSFHMTSTSTANTQKSGDITHIKGSGTMNIAGMEFTTDIDQWSKGNTTWAYNAENDEWVKTEAEKSDETDVDVENLNASMFSDLKLATDGDEYIVTGTLNQQDLMDSMSKSVESIAGDMPTNLTISATICYDQETYVMNTMHLDINAETDINAEVETFTIDYVINSIDALDLTLPENLK